MSDIAKKDRGDQSGEEQSCYRSGAKGHWSRNCRTPKHIVDLYQLSKNKGKGQYESHLAIEPEAQKSGDSTGLKFKMRRHKGQHERWRRPNGRPS